MSDLYSFERVLARQGYKAVCGTDEAGAGPLAGPVYAAAVILNPDVELCGVNDSKKLSEKKREELYDIIIEKSVAFNIVSVSEKVIDEINILNARMLAMRNAVAGLAVKPDYLLVDGNSDPMAGIETMTIVKGDGRSASVAAASILAKVSRDRFMLEMDRFFPQYAFAKHKGYGTKQHIDMLRKYGPCPIHRLTFIKNILGGKVE